MENNDTIISLYAKSCNHGLLRNNKIAKIGEVHSAKCLVKNGELTFVKTIIFDWYETGEKDTFIFGEDGLIGSVINMNTTEEMIDQYKIKLKLHPKFDRFTENIISYFVFSELGF